ncbi:hypothetical protein, partial [Zwartia vadi]|uniref:hypothetical protein n=1 Tax=Zwartia vadi TaxID=3058168 RepID=UPI0025B3630D
MTLKPKKFVLAKYLNNIDVKGLSNEHLYILRHSNTFENVSEYLSRKSSDKRIKKIVDHLERIQAGHQGLLNTDHDSLEWNCYKVLCKYEEIRRGLEIKKRYTASRLRKSGETTPWKVVLEKTVSKPLKDETLGFKVLREGGRLDASFEFYILENPTLFSDKSVASSY